MSTLVVSFSTRFNSGGETQWSQLLDDVSHVVVEVTTYDYRSSGVLPDNVPGDFNHPFSSFFQVRLVARLEITIEYLNVLVAELQLGPTEISAKCFH